MKKIGVIFDMDGVLVDSTKSIWASFNKLLEPHGIHFTNEEITREYLGLSLRDQMRLWKEKYGIELEVEKFSKEAGNMEIKMMANKQVNLDLLCLLKELKANKFPMGVGTSSLRWRAEEIIRLLRIKGYFSVIVSAEDVVHHKPNPDLFLKVAEELKVPPGNCVVIEDASSGIEAAKRGGMKAIGYLTDYNNPEELKKADLIISSFKELDSEKIKILFE